MMQHEAKAIISDLRSAVHIKSAEIARLTRELDEAKKQHGEALDGARTYWNRIAELEARLAWHPVSEKPPVADDYLIVHTVDDLDDEFVRVAVCYPASVGWNVPDAYKVQYWREIGALPAAPNEAGK